MRIQIPEELNLCKKASRHGNDGLLFSSVDLSEGFFEEFGQIKDLHALADVVRLERSAAFLEKFEEIFH